VQFILLNYVAFTYTKDSYTKLTFHSCQYTDTQRLATLCPTGQFLKKKRDPELMKTVFAFAQRAFLELFEL
jgi:hypothetical protein